IGTKQRLNESQEQKDERTKKLSEAIKTIIECIGEDPKRQGLLRTPDRYAQALLFFSKGYEESIEQLINGAIFEEDHDEMVIVKNIDVFSLCEHHL
ncbi:34183_t:CDS:2, partial [Racocetra persica]